MDWHSPLCKRIIPCLDVDNGRTVKGTKFQNLRDMGNPVEMGAEYERQGADELMFLDITASHEERATMLQIVHDVADRLSIPFTVGGGISSLDDVKRLLDGGADKVSVNTAAVNNPALVSEIARQCGSQCCVVAIDARKQEQSWVVLTRGGRVDTGMDAWEWAQKAVDLGAGEILLTSWDRDGTLSGFDLELMERFSTLSVPVIASGGAHSPQSFIDVFTAGAADAALAASIFHNGTWTVEALKREIDKAGITVRI